MLNKDDLFLSKSIQPFWFQKGTIIFKILSCNWKFDKVLVSLNLLNKSWQKCQNVGQYLKNANVYITFSKNVNDGRRMSFYVQSDFQSSYYYTSHSSKKQVLNWFFKEEIVSTENSFIYVEKEFHEILISIQEICRWFPFTRK